MDVNAMNLANILTLSINPRDIYTQMGVFRLGKVQFLKRIRHDNEELKKFSRIADQTSYRTDLIMKVLEDNEIPLEDVRLVMGRGGLLHPVESGIYEVNNKMKEDLSKAPVGEDVVNLGGLIADEIANRLPDARAFVANPVVVDEFCDLARVSGHPLIQRKSIFHALHQKYIARKHAQTVGKNYEDLVLIVVNLGRAITVGAHLYGKVIDANQGFDGDGPFSTIGSGSLPVGDLIHLCFSGKYTEEDMMKMVWGEGGLFAYLGTHSGYEVDKRVQQGDEKARFFFEAMAYQVAKTVGAMATTFTENPDGILITGAMANSKILVELIIKRIEKIGPIHIYPGDDDLEALAWNAMMMLRGEIKPKKYT